MILSVCSKFEFCYGHVLPEHEGKCKNLHGHNAILEVEVFKKISITESTFGIEQGTYEGMLVDFGDFKHYVQHRIIDFLDHKYINDVLDENFLPPTAENMCRWVWKQLCLYEKWKSILLRVRIYETPNNYAEIKREV